MASVSLKKSYKCMQSLQQFYTGGPYAVASDESFLVCACDEKIKIVDLSNASIKSTIEGDSEAVTALALSPNNNILFSASHSRQIRVWNLSTLECIRSWKGHEGPVMGMASDASGGLLVTAGADRKVLVWDVDGGFCTHYFKGHKGVVTSIMFHPDPNRLLVFSGGDDGSVRVWDLIGKKCLSTLEKHQSAITSMAISEDGWTLLSAGRDKVVNLWNLHNYGCMTTIPMFESLEALCIIGPESPFAASLSSLTYLQTKKRSDVPSINFITVGERGLVRIWSADRALCLFEQKSSDIAVSSGDEDSKRGFISALLMPASQELLCVTADQQFFLYCPEESEGGLNLVLRKRFIGYNEEIVDMKFLGDEEQFLAVSTSVEQVRVYDLTSMSCSYVLAGHTDVILCLDTCLSSSGRTLIVTGSKDNTVRLWDCQSKACVGVGIGHMGAVGAVAFSKKQRNFFVSGSSDRTLKVWNVDSVSDNNEEVLTLKAKAVVAAHDKDINCLAVAPNDSLVCSGSQDRTACIWRLPDLVSVVALKGHKRGIWSVEFSPVDQCVMTASGDKTIKIWAISDGTCLKTFEGHQSSVLRASFLTHGTQIVSCGADCMVKLWTVKTNECIATYDQHEEKIWALAVGKKTEMLATGGGDAVINLCQGEAKGYINLGELHYRIQKYDEAMKCYEWALKLAKSMEDEDALISQANQNIEIVKEARKVMDEIKIGEQSLKKLSREIEIARGTEGERKCLLQQNSALDRLIEKCSAIFAWVKHCKFAKKKKQTAIQLCDKEKLSDSFLAIGESHQKLRHFDKALKWYNKSLDTYRSIGNLEGQALAKINIGNVLDCNGNWGGALAAFEEGYRIAIQAKKSSIELSALENMHYSQMIRFDNVEEARKLQSSIDKLKQSKIGDLEAENVAGDCCSESETEVGNLSPITSYDSITPKKAKRGFKKSKSYSSEDEFQDLPLKSLIRPSKNLSKLKSTYVETPIATTELPDSASPSISRPAGSQAVGRKRVRLVLSDDEDDNEDVYSSSRIVSTPLEGEMGHCSGNISHKCSVEAVATSDESKDTKHQCSLSHELKVVSPVGSGCAVSACTPINLEESTCSDKSRTPELGLRDDKDFTYSSTKRSAPKFSYGACGRELDADVSGNGSISDLTPHACGEHCQHILFRVVNNVVHVKWDSGNAGTKLSLEQMKVEVACLFYLQLSAEERSKGLVPVIQHMMHEGRVIESLEAVNILKDNMAGKACIEVSIDVWVPKHLMKLYIDCCEELSQPPILKVLKMLYNQEVSEDEVVVSDCELQDISVTPLINALYVHKTFAVLDLSHNLLGNGTIEKLKQVFIASGQKYGGLTLDLHCNRLGSTALFQICECDVLYARLEVLNLSGNRLTDACASYLSTILQNCKALYSLNIEQCSITSRTIQKVADSLTSGSVLTHLSLGHNQPVAANVVLNLLVTLTNLKRFQELSLKGIKLSKPVIESLCQLIKSSCLSGLLLGNTSIGTDGMLKLMQSLSRESQELKLDVSSCGLTPDCIVRLNAEVSVFNSIVELDLGGNQLKQEGGRALAAAVSNPQCCFRVLLLQKCQLGLLGILSILKGLSDNYYLEELNVAENADQNKIHALLHDPCSNVLQTDIILLEHTSEVSAANAKEGCQEGLCTLSTDYNQLEAPDSEDEQVEVDVTDRATNQSCIKNHSNLDEYEYIQELPVAIQMAKNLQLLDLSNNGFTKQLTESLYAAWGSSSRSGSSRGHIEGNTVHLSVEGVKCCPLKPCCRRI